MSSKEKKLKSSRAEDKKSAKRGEEITIVIDGSNSESASPTKQDPDITNNPTPENKESIEALEISEPIVEILPSDASRLTEIIIERYEGETKHGQYEGLGEAWFHNGNYYKGEFSQGLMHGDGLFVFSDGLKYSGEFINNTISGKGTYSWPDGSTYTGDVMNGLRHGIGSYVDKTQKRTYTGEWNRGKRNGKGRMEYGDEASYYEGEWNNNYRHGQGVRQYPTGNVYKGMWYYNVRHGEGTMKWVDSNQMYIGQWEDGIQHGLGQHVWFVRRVVGSQYSLRNTYNGEFVKGIRHGFGTFYYANGSKYEGYWQSNMKHGKGRFTFKNGRYYEGNFEYDHIKEFPNFEMDGRTTPDQDAIRTRTPLPLENMSVHSNASINSLGPSFQVDLSALIQNTKYSCDENDSRQVVYVVKRHMSALKKIYDFYSSLGYYDSSDNTFILSHMQFIRLLADCNMHHKHLTLLQMDESLIYQAEDAHSPHQRILFREFINHIILLSVHLYADTNKNDDGVVQFHACVHKIISDHILQNSCKIKGHIFTQARRAVHALDYLDRAYEIYRTLRLQLMSKTSQGYRMRDFLYLMRELQLINSDLTARVIIQQLTMDNPNATDEQDGYNLEVQITFLEFFETLIGCAEHYVTEALAKDPNMTPVPLGDGQTNPQTELSLASEPTSGRSATNLDVEEEVDGKSSIAANVTPRSNTPAAPVTTGSVVDGQSSTGQLPTTTHSKLKSDLNESSKEGQCKRASQPQILSPLNTIKRTSHLAVSEAVLDVERTLDNIHFLDTDEPMVEPPFLADADPAEEIDDTRKFHFWVQQLHIFFEMKFFPAYNKYQWIRGSTEQRYATNPSQKPEHLENCICRNHPQDHLKQKSQIEEILRSPLSQPIVTPAPSGSAIEP